MELEIIRRTRMVGTSITYKQPVLKVESPKGRFFLTRMASDLMGLKQNDGIMFGFNFGEQKCYVFKDDEIDSFRLREADKGSTLRFTSKDLLSHFNTCFELNGGRTFFKVSKSDKGFSIQPIKD